MAAEKSVNSQITDSVTQVNTKVVGETPAMAMGNQLLSASQVLSNAAHNTTKVEENDVTAGITGEVTSKIFGKE